LDFLFIKTDTSKINHQEGVKFAHTEPKNNFLWQDHAFNEKRLKTGLKSVFAIL
jgi:hypothetical protein